MGEHREEEPEELAESLQEPVTKTAILRTVAEVRGDIKQIQVVATVLTNHPRKKDKKPKET